MNIVIHGRFQNRQDFFQLVGRAAWGTGRPSPTNLDGLADLLKETGLVSITVYGMWQIDEKAASAIRRVCEDQSVLLRLPSAAV